MKEFNQKSLILDRSKFVIFENFEYIDEKVRFLRKLNSERYAWKTCIKTWNIIVRKTQIWAEFFRILFRYYFFCGFLLNFEVKSSKL